MEALCAGEDLRLVGGEEGRAHRTESRGRDETRTRDPSREKGGRPSTPHPRLKDNHSLIIALLLFSLTPRFRYLGPPSSNRISSEIPPSTTKHRHHRPRPSPRIRPYQMPRIPASPATPHPPQSATKPPRIVSARASPLASLSIITAAAVQSRPPHLPSFPRNQRGTFDQCTAGPGALGFPGRSTTSCT